MRAPERGGRSDGARYWCNARLELLVAEGRYEDAVEAAEEYARALRPLPQPRRPRAGARCGRSRSTRSGMKRKAIELAAEELDRARDWGAPGTVARSLRVLGLLEGAEGLERLEEAVEVVSARAGAARAGQVARRARRHAPPRRPPRLRARAADARARAGRGVRRRAPARRRSGPRCSPSASSPRSRDAARRELR